MGILEAEVIGGLQMLEIGDNNCVHLYRDHYKICYNTIGSVIVFLREKILIWACDGD